MGWETPRAAPLWIPAFAGMTRAEGPLRVPLGQASTGSGRTDLGGAPSVGSGGAMEWETPRASPLWIPAFAGMTRAGECGKDERWGRPRASPLPWVPARAGTTMGGVVGCVGARGWCQGGGPLSRAGGSRTAPTTGVGRTRARVMRGLLVVGGALRQAQGERIWEARVRWGVGGGMGWETPRAAPLPWVPSFAGTTVGECGPARAGGGGWGDPAAAGGHFDRLRANGCAQRRGGGRLGS